MARGIREFPHLLYADQSKMDKIRANWVHKFKNGEEVWILDRNKRQVSGPYTFAHYSPASAVVLFKYAQGYFGSRRVKFLDDNVMYQSEKEANHDMGVLKVMDFLDHQHKADALINEIELLLGKQLADTIRKST